MAQLPPRKNPTPTRISKQHLTPLQTLLQMGFTKHRAEKALAATGNRGVQIASDWLLAHVNDSSLDEINPREYILYACPIGPFLHQLEEFWNKSRMVCGWNGAHNYVPHITLVSFFKAPDESSLQLSKALKQVVDMSGTLLDRPLKLEPYISQNFMGFFVAEDDANYLKRLSLQYVKEVSNSSQTQELIGGCSSFKEDSESSVDKYLRETLQPCLDLTLMQKVNNHNKTHNKDHLSQSQQIVILSQQNNLQNTNSFELSSLQVMDMPIKSNDMEIMVEPIGVAAPSADDTLSMDSERSQEVASLGPTTPSNRRRVYIMRHGERVDFTFGTWIPYCFDEFSNYVRKDLNMPKSLPKRQRCPDGWQNDSPLTNIGLYQAKLTGEALFESKVRIDHVYCSPAYRCVQTCISTLEGMQSRQKFKVKLEPGLFEWMAWYPDGVPDWLSKSELLDADYDVDINYQPLISANELNDCIKETTEEFYTRNYEIIRKIIETTSGNILVVAHATTLDTCTRQLVGGAPRSTNELRQVIHKIPYCSLGTIEEIDGSGVWKLVEPECLPVTHSKNPRFEWNALNAT
ncbi:ecdysteroid-phosphate phosphatase isoform X3 [Eurosta solidaginis]|uniref:ecdysteroid-phosphate phosphatase isoform X3 n=1 Tax=Eurosta solidaginis TaxID=178769 RepID=UPI0035312A6E